MEVKTKAIELVEYFKNIIEDKFAKTDCKETEYMLKQRAKLCALKLIDEIVNIKSVVDPEESGLSLDYAKDHTSYKTYWLRVKESVTLL
jgi:spore coat protein CotF